MTALRPERESDTSYGQQSYGVPGAFEDWSGGGAYGASPRPEPQPQPQSQPYMSEPEPQPQPYTPEPYPESYEPVPDEPYRPVVDEETVALRIPDPPPAAGDPVSGDRKSVV